MPIRTAFPLVMPLALVLTIGCGGDDSTSDRGSCSSKISVGDLVITEIYGNSPGGDDGNEWFEIYNAATSSLNLKGMLLIKSNQEGDSRREHEMKEIVIEPGQYLVVGGILEEFRWDYIDYGYGPDLGAMGNSSGRLQLSCGEVLIDRVDYEDLAEGKSLQLSSLFTPPTADDNDDSANFCSGSDLAFFQDQLGTPQAENEFCAPLTQDECIDDGAIRPVNKAAMGDVVISEFMANPTAVADADGEWLEIRVVNAIDLNGLQIGKAEADTGPGDVEMAIAAAECLVAAPGDYVVLAINTDSALNGGVDADFALDFSLTNSNDGLFLALAGSTIHTVTYQSTKAGAATQLDLEGDACDATLPYGDGDLGTPGGANGECETVVIVPDGQCLDGDGVTVRDINSPGVGNVTINEWMPNPDSNPGGSDTTGEWIEFLADSGGPYDLNGLVIDASSNADLDSSSCLTIAASGLYLVADSADPTDNGNMMNVNFERSLSISNDSSGNTATINLTLDANVLDTISYTGGTGGDFGPGEALQITLDADQCIATQSYGDGDLGTPGLGNDASCP